MTRLRSTSVTSTSSEGGAAKVPSEPNVSTDPPPTQLHGRSKPASAAGLRVALRGDLPLPDFVLETDAPFKDLDGSPIYMGSAKLGRSVHPCKIAPKLNNPCRVPYGAIEYQHLGRYDLLHYEPDRMEWISTRKGLIPDGHVPVQGGYEAAGNPLYHAKASISGITVPGKTGTHLGGALVPFGNKEHIVKEAYEILCWRHGVLI